MFGCFIQLNKLCSILKHRIVFILFMKDSFWECSFRSWISESASTFCQNNSLQGKQWVSSAWSEISEHCLRFLLFTVLGETAFQFWFFFLLCYSFTRLSERHCVYFTCKSVMLLIYFCVYMLLLILLFYYDLVAKSWYSFNDLILSMVFLSFWHFDCFEAVAIGLLHHYWRLTSDEKF